MTVQKTASLPKVALILSVHNPGWWFRDTLESLKSLDFEQLSVLVVDSSDNDQAISEIAQVWPNAFVKRIPSSISYTQSLNAAIASIEGATHILICHDDIAPAPDALSLMIAQSYKSNAAIVVPKYLNWHNSTLLESLGLNSDRLAVVSARVEPNELDQGQHDFETEIPVAQGGMLLVRADLLTALKGFDEAIDLIGETLEFSWRSRLAGAKIVLEPRAAVRHLFATLSGERNHNVSGFELYRKSELRTLLVTYRSFNLVMYLSIWIVFALTEITLATIKGKKKRASAILGALVWNLKNLKTANSKRKDLKELQQVSFHRFKKSLLPVGQRLVNYLENLVIHRGYNPYIDNRFEDYQYSYNVFHQFIYVFYVLIAFWFVGSIRNSFTAGFPETGQFLNFLTGAQSIKALLLSSNLTKLYTIMDLRQILVFFFDVITFNHPFLAREVFLISICIFGFVGLVKLVSYLTDLSTKQGAVQFIIAALVFFGTPLVFQSFNQGNWILVTSISVAFYYQLVTLKLVDIADKGLKEFLWSRPFKQFIALEILTMILAPVTGLVEAIFSCMFVILSSRFSNNNSPQVKKNALAIITGALSVNFFYYLELLINIKNDFAGFLGNPVPKLSFMSYLYLSSGQKDVGFWDIALIGAFALALIVLNDQKASIYQTCWILAFGLLTLSFISQNLPKIGSLADPGIFMIPVIQMMPVVVVGLVNWFEKQAYLVRTTALLVGSLFLVISLLGFYQAFLSGTLLMSQPPQQVAASEGYIADISFGAPLPGLCPKYRNVFSVCLTNASSKLGQVELISYNKHTYNVFVGAINEMLSGRTKFVGANLASVGIKEITLNPATGPSTNDQSLANALNSQFDIKPFGSNTNLYVIQENPAKTPIGSINGFSVIVILQIALWIFWLFVQMKFKAI